MQIHGDSVQGRIWHEMLHGMASWRYGGWCGPESWKNLLNAAGVLRAASKTIPRGVGLDTALSLRTSAEERIKAVTRDLISKTGGFTNLVNDLEVGFLLQCVSLALVRGDPVSCRASLLTCLASALLTETFPLQKSYTKILNHPHDNLARKWQLWQCTQMVSPLSSIMLWDVN